MTDQEYLDALTAYSASALKLMEKHIKVHDKAKDKIIAELSKIYQNNWSFEDYKKFGRSGIVEKRIIEIIDGLYKDQHSIIYDILKSEYADKSTVQISVIEQKNKLKAIAKVFDAGAAINQPNGGVYWFDRLGKNRNDVLFSLSNTINAGLYNGISYSDITKNLQNVFGDDLIRNDTIARTETRRVTSVAQTDVCDAVADDVGLIKTWKTMQDELVRHGGKGKGNHVKMNGVTIPYGQDFITPTGSKGKAPHQLKGPNSAGDNCNCRCIMLIKVK